MASVKVKFRPSTIEGKEGTVYYQIIQNRVIRQLKTDYDYPEPCNPSVKDGLPDIYERMERSWKLYHCR